MVEKNKKLLEALKQRKPKLNSQLGGKAIDWDNDIDSKEDKEWADKVWKNFIGKK